MTALYIIVGIIAFFVLILSVRITLRGEYFDEFKLDVSWLFLKFNIFPLKKKDKPKKEKAPKEKKEEAPPKEEPKPEGEKKENIFIKFCKNQGVDGVVKLINNAAYSLARMMNSFKKHIVLRELYLWMTVSSAND
ncbi:MAG: hypothetical protein ACI4SX_02515, partial [Candidatus Fimenecus sp.]